jgi:hypothetical protein
MVQPQGSSPPLGRQRTIWLQLICNLFRFFANLLPSTLSRQGLFDSALCAGLEVEGVALHFLYDVFRLNLTLEATESAFY